jgi:hypothetical protein
MPGHSACINAEEQREDRELAQAALKISRKMLNLRSNISPLILKKIIFKTPGAF